MQHAQTVWRWLLNVINEYGPGARVSVDDDAMGLEVAGTDARLEIGGPNGSDDPPEVYDPSRCPVCASEDISGEGIEPDSESTACRNVECSACGAHWQESFVISGHVVLVRDRGDNDSGGPE